MNTLQIDSLRFLDRGPYSLTVNSAQCVCLTGASGSGKTLFLRNVADLDSHQGLLFLNQVESMVFKPSVWRTQVGLLPAESRWWAENVNQHFTSYDIRHLNQLGFEPDVMDWEVRRLSTGERQRLAIVRLLGNKPRVLLLDEPTASLDPGNVLNVEAVIKSYSLQEQAPVLWVSHDLEQVKRVGDRHYEMSENQLIEKR